MNTWFDMGTGGVLREAYVGCTDILMVFQMSGAARTGTWWIDNVNVIPRQLRARSARRGGPV